MGEKTYLPIEEILRIFGFCKGLSIRDGIDLDEDEREMLLRAGKFILATAKVIQELRALAGFQI
jgi:hypothetical protein